MVIRHIVVIAPENAEHFQIDFARAAIAYLQRGEDGKNEIRGAYLPGGFFYTGITQILKVRKNKTVTKLIRIGITGFNGLGIPKYELSDLYPYGSQPLEG